MSNKIVAQPTALNNTQPPTIEYQQDGRFYPSPTILTDAELFTAYESAASIGNHQLAALYLDALTERKGAVNGRQ